jgi:hypothetical protein
VALQRLKGKIIEGQFKITKAIEIDSKKIDAILPGLFQDGVTRSWGLF